MIVALVDEATDPVVTLNVADVAPAATVTLVGVDAAAVLLLDSETVQPPDGADPFSTTVPCEVDPLVTELGLRETEDKAGGKTVTSAVLVIPAFVADIVEELDDATAEVAIGKVVLDDPCGTVTLCGTDALAPLLLDRLTTMPPDGATELSVTVPCELVPPVTLDGLAARLESTIG